MAVQQCRPHTALWPTPSSMLLVRQDYCYCAAQLRWWTKVSEVLFWSEETGLSPGGLIHFLEVMVFRGEPGSSKNTPPLHWSGALTLESVNLQNKLKVDMLCCRWKREHQRVPKNTTDSSVPKLEWVCAFPEEKMISWTLVPETLIHYS